MYPFKVGSLALFPDAGLSVGSLKSIFPVENHFLMSSTPSSPIQSLRYPVFCNFLPYLPYLSIEDIIHTSYYPLSNPF